MKKLIFALGLLFLCSSNADAATKYVLAAGGNWSADATWSTTSGGVADTTKCVVTDDCKLDANSGNVTVDVASAALSLVATGFTGTLTLGADLTIAGTTTLVSGMTFTPSTYAVIFTSGSDFTITSGGKAFGAVTFNTGAPYPTITLGDDLTVNGTLTNSNYIKSFAGAYTIHAKGDVTCSGANSLSYNADSAASFAIDGSGNQAVNFTMADATYPHRINVDVNSSGGTVTFANATHYFAKNLSKTAGTVDFTTNTSTVMLKGQTGNASLMSATLYNLTFSTFVGSLYTTTLQGDVTVNNTTTLTSGTGFPTLNGYALYMNGDLVGSTGSSFYAGTTDLYVSGTGTQAIDFRTDPSYPTANKVYITNSGTVNLNSGTNYFKNDLIFNGTGTYNLAGTINYKTGTITYTAGTVSAGTSVLSISGASTLNTNGMSWYDITMGANITLGSDLDFSHNFTRTAGAVSGAYYLSPTGATTHVIDGTNTISGFDCATGETCSFDDADIFTITNGKGNGTWQSDDATNTVDIDFTAETISYGAGIRVDSAGGVAVTTVGSITDCVNWSDASSPVTTAYTWVG